MTSISFRGTFKSFWDLTEVGEQSWYKVLSHKIVYPTFKISLLKPQERKKETQVPPTVFERHDLFIWGGYD